MKSRPAQYAGLVLLLAASLAVIFLPIGPPPEPHNYQVALTAPKAFQELAGPKKVVSDEADNALAAEFKTNETLPQGLIVGSDGKEATISDRAATRAEAQTRAERIIKALSKPFKGIKLGSEWSKEVETIPTPPLFALGNFAIFPPHERNGQLVPAVKLGLDLQGGVNLVLQVRRAMFSYSIGTPVQGSAARDALLDKIRTALNATDASLGLKNADVVLNPRDVKAVATELQIRTQATDENQFTAQTQAIEKLVKEFKETPLIPSGKPVYYGGKSSGAGAATPQDILKTTVEILRQRVDKLGVSEPIIQAQGTDRIIVQLPGLTDPEQAVATIGTTAQMRILLLPADLNTVPDPNDSNITLFRDSKGNPVSSKDALQRCLTESTTALRRLLPNEKFDNDSAVVSGSEVSPTTTAGFTSEGQTTVAFELQGLGPEHFAAVTREAALSHRQIPIFLDDVCISAPQVISAITQGKGEITMGKSPLKDAQSLALLLNSGALPAPIDVVENRTVSASLGNDSLVKSLRAGLIGILAVAIFMIVFYRLPGILANCALAAYCVLNLACFVLVGGTLTLPGIAGFLLAVAMSLDTNILVFERLKEEMAIQPTFSAALRAAFSRAWTAILDSHVTTLTASIVLFYFGTGPVKGFALTLGIGVLLSLFSAISVTRLFMWSAAALGEKNPKLFAGKLPEKSIVLAQHGQ